MSKVILEAAGLKKHFVTRRPLFGAPTVVRAVDGVDLRIAAGETFSIVGESGCGKSTLARLLIRLIEPTEGSVLHEGRDIAGLGARDMRRLRRDLQFVFQDPFSSLNPRMTVGGLLEEPMRVHGMGDARSRRAEAQKLLARVGLRGEYVDRYPHEFSGGQRQRIGIARALATGPRVLIGDEPVSALDVSVQAQVINLLDDLKREYGLTLVMIAHDLSVVRHMSDRVGVMYLGQMVEVAPAGELFGRPLHPYTQALMSAIPAPEPGRAHSGGTPLRGDIPSPSAPPPGCRFHTRCPHATELCASQMPALEPLAGARHVACHHHRSIGPGAGLPDPPARSARVEQRFALYRDLQSKRSESRPQTGPTAETTGERR